MKFTFDKGMCVTTTASGKKAYIYENDFNLNRQYYTLYIEDELIFTRGTLAKVAQMLRQK